MNTVVNNTDNKVSALNTSSHMFHVIDKEINSKTKQIKSVGMDIYRQLEMRGMDMLLLVVPMALLGTLI
ncbi:hypothetical protein [Vibrio sp. SCSIO 43136]|uniref:hypothetical protein n=1 Tax=Vibrio sp. SCSIO 43136 TaxID=2819101 RepID=UPI00207520F5|nr:hypothetical protein [Vibrio sp. SCSIO 43136]USD65871.1 hypothetical protein J4N39_03350 [Vibrio sp. SCSIO 43136]